MPNWDHARPLARVPSLNDDAGAAVLWADRREFVILWEPYDGVLSTAPNTHGRPRVLIPFRKKVEQARAGGLPIVPCFTARRRQLDIGQVAALVQRKELSWEPFSHAVPTPAGFAQKEVSPDDNPHHMIRLYRALQRKLTPGEWQQIRPLLPGDVEDAFQQAARARVIGVAVVLGTFGALAAVIIWVLSALVRGLLL